MQIAVVENAAPGRYLERSLLLASSALNEILVMNDLQPEKATADEQRPANKKASDMKKAEAPRDCTCLQRSRRVRTRPLSGWLGVRRIAEKKELLQAKPATDKNFRVFTSA
jgi:hypothetical protein